MTNTKLNYNGIWKQNVSTSENALKKTPLLRVDSDIKIPESCTSLRVKLSADSSANRRA